MCIRDSPWQTKSNRGGLDCASRHSTRSTLTASKSSIENWLFGLTLSQCAFKHNKLEFMFHKKQVPHIHTHTSWHTSHVHHAHIHHTHMYARVYTCTHCGSKAILQNFILIDYILQILKIKMFGFLLLLTLMDSKRCEYQNSHHLFLM